MKFAYLVDNTVTGLNRAGQGDELTGTCTPQQLVWGMVAEYYTAPGGALTPKTQAEIDEVNALKQKEANSAKAAQSQSQVIKELEEEGLRAAYNLPPTMTDEDVEARENSIQLLQGDIDNPTDNPVYNPPLPPGVNPPPHQTLTVTVTREEGHLGALGWRAVISSMDEGFTPSNLAMSVHTGPDCDGYKYTTGAFQWDSVAEEWFSICPPGQEPGDVDEFLGVLYGSAELGCFTLLAGIPTVTVNVYEAA